MPNHKAAWEKCAGNDRFGVKNTKSEFVRDEDDIEEHHLGGIPPPPDDSDHFTARFPRDSWIEIDTQAGRNLEVEGFEGFNHVRCPVAEPKACPCCSRYTLHRDSIVIAVDGACPGNGRNAKRSGVGIYFGEHNAEDFNLSGRVPDDPDNNHTSQRAELYAAIVALQKVRDFVKEGGQSPCRVSGCQSSVCYENARAKHVVIKSDSSYLVNSITSHIIKWRSNGWQTASKKPVANQDLWEKLTQRILQVQGLGAFVEFWLVSREENRDADWYAKQAVGD